MFDTDKVIVVADVTKQPYLSVARFSGGCRVNGVFYAYVPQRDILVREDWLKAYSAMDYDKFIAAVKTGTKQELPTCRTCKHRQRWELNDHSTKIVQSCALQKSRRTGNGLKRIKVTNPACCLYEKEENLWDKAKKDIVGVAYTLNEMQPAITTIASYRT